MSGLITNDKFKNPEYEWAHKAWDLQEKLHWVADAVPMSKDINDWNNKLTDVEKNVVSQIFRFFTQGDIDIAHGYYEYLRIFKPVYVRNMMTAFANMETIHINAYAYLLDTLGLPPSEYEMFKSYEEMVNKHNYIMSFNLDTPADIAKSLAAYSAFGEGLQLFSSFAILFNFQRFGKLNGVGTIVTYSVRDESLHVESMLKLFHQFRTENPSIWTNQLKKELHDICRTMVRLEDEFIDLAFSKGDIEGLTAADVKKYIRFIANRRLQQLNLKPEYVGITSNPLPWMDTILAGVEHTNFFENRSTEYAKASLSGDWGDVFPHLKAGVK